MRAIVYEKLRRIQETRDDEDDVGSMSRSRSEQVRADVGDPLQKIPVAIAPDETGEDAIDNYIQFVKNGARRHKEVEWFTPGTSWHRWRQRCRRWREGECFNVFFTVVVVLGAAAMGASVNGDMSNDVAWYVESVFLVLYSFELCVRLMGSPLYPWYYPSLWMDTFVVFISAFDVWFLKLAEVAGIAARAQLGACMSLRLFRFWRFFNVTEGIARYARPVRLLKGAISHSPGLASAIFLIWFWYLFLSSMVLRSTIEGSQGEPVWQENFATTGDSMVTFASTLSTRFNSMDITLQLEDAGGGVSAATFRMITYFAKSVLVNLVLSILVDSLFKEGDFDDQVTAMQRVRKDFHIRKLRTLLKTCKPENSELYLTGREHQDIVKIQKVQGTLMSCIDGRHRWKKGAYRKLFAMNAEDVVQLMKEADKSKEGFVQLNSFMLDLFIKRCAGGSLDDMGLERNLQQCRIQMRQNHHAASELIGVLNKQEERDKEAERGPQTHGLHQNVGLAMGSIVQRRTEAEAVYDCIDDLMSELLGGVKDLNKYINGTDWNYAKADVPDAAIQIASMQFQSSLECLTNYLQLWSDASLAAQERVDESFGPARRDDLVCEVCGHRHPEPDTVSSMPQ